MQQEIRKLNLGQPPSKAPLEPEAFLLWSAARPREQGRFELSQSGTIIMQAGTTRFHNVICMNVISGLRRQLDVSAYTVAHADFAVRAGHAVRYPDVVVDRPDSLQNSLVAHRPILIVEVLSPSTTGTDFTTKLHEYSTIETLRTYVICSQDEARVWVWTRRRDKSWPGEPTETSGRRSTVKLGLPKLELRLAEVYQGVPVAKAAG